MLQDAAVGELGLCWIVWSVCFLKPRQQATGQKKVVRDPASRWGILVQILGCSMVWMYVRPEGFEKSAPALIASMLVGPLAVALGWAATRRIGKQWRYEAALIEDHELIQTGAYAWVRHPIYASMLGMVLATGLAWTWWPMFIAGMIVFMTGTEIRVRAEERLLAARFQESFTAYRSRVPAYIPFIR
jgi:protein-S-isoprenylcysteine O-methyltransferase Ste14